MGIKTLILDSSTGNTGAIQTLKQREIEGAKGSYVQCEIGAGDTVVLEGKVDSLSSFVTLAIFTADSVIEVDLPPVYRARRTIDGITEDSTVYLQTPNIQEVV